LNRSVAPNSSSVSALRPSRAHSWLRPEHNIRRAKGTGNL
jgi:hypothetical protein